MNAVITGLGLVTPLGRTAHDTWRALLDGRSILDHARLESSLNTMPRISGLAIEAARQAIAQSQWSDRPIPETALVVGTSKGPIENWITSNNLQIQSGGSNFGLARLAADISEHIPLIDGPALTVSAACATGLHALIRGVMMIQSGQVTRVLVVAAEASVHPLFLASFRRLGVVPPLGELCRPFDKNRSGFLISEAAAAICLESSAVSSRAIATIENFAMGSDATHLTAGDSQGKTLRRLLNQVIDNRPVDLIHAHGTGTVFNDPVELSAIGSVLENLNGRPPVIYSHKGALGHSLGAAGLVSIVLNCMSHEGAVVPGNVNTSDALNSPAAVISNGATHGPIRRSLACASGFGGAIAALSLTSK